MRHASRGCCFRAGMDAPSRSRDAQPERSHSGNARTAQREHLLSRSPAHPARIRMAVCRRKVPASATRHSLLPGRRCPEVADEGATTPALLISPPPHAARHATRSAIGHSAEPLSPIGYIPQDAAIDRRHRAPGVPGALPHRAHPWQSTHTRLRNISWLLLANRRHRRISVQDRINQIFYRNTGNSDESSRLVRITNRLNANFSSWSHQMQTDPTAV
ncbi:conserved hypothetical protein [Xanthomonas phaseoli pv. phaseoli]|uniref:Uncharacterized protein n=1 Tax=Xanthomonas campestris pv. phaseoli TaxID=317013 RepID=A0AB38E537_XANCH|nr:conserved hypothetical protein [Xanthomonas phaseoli pv. phaseoli]SON91879.1 conserved hypothetical protein [Xanthomonas phaseoli pv. phaseoli]